MIMVDAKKVQALCDGIENLSKRFDAHCRADAGEDYAKKVEHHEAQARSVQRKIDKTDREADKPRLMAEKKHHEDLATAYRKRIPTRADSGSGTTANMLGRKDVDRLSTPNGKVVARSTARGTEWKATPRDGESKTFETEEEAVAWLKRQPAK